MRVCDYCGKKIEAGMTNDQGDMYLHEGECFEKWMDETYGKHKWMERGDGEEGENGGYYMFSADVVGGYLDTGIYYTEWYDEDDEEEEY